MAITQCWYHCNISSILIMGSNAAENHPISFHWVTKAMEKGATLIHVDPRFTRTSARANIYAPLRSGTASGFCRRQEFQASVPKRAIRRCSSFAMCSPYPRTFFSAPYEMMSPMLSTNLTFSGMPLAREPRRRMGVRSRS